MTKERQLLHDLARWLDPMHMSPPSYQDCCAAHKDIMALLNQPGVE